MNFNSKVYAVSGLIIAALLVILGIGYAAAKHSQVSETVPVPSQTSTTSVQGKGYTIQEVPVTPANPVPSLDHKINFSASVPAAVRADIQAKADAAVAILKKDPSDGNDWYNLAILYHIANDFDGARVVWEFLAKGIPAPQNAVALENLAKLYHFDLKEYPKAESYFKQAIAANPNTIDPYMELYQLYLYSYKQNTTLAVDTLNAAARAFPVDPSPYLVLGGYYRDKGDAVDARAAFNKAMDRARAEGDVSAIKNIGDELAKLPQ